MNIKSKKNITNIEFLKYNQLTNNYYDIQNNYDKYNNNVTIIENYDIPKCNRNYNLTKLQYIIYKNPIVNVNNNLIKLDNNLNQLNSNLPNYKSINNINFFKTNKKLSLFQNNNLNYYSDYIIPRIIHFIWVGKYYIPTHYIKYINSWKNYNIKWKIRFWTNYDIIFYNFININKINDSCKYAQKADIMRYEIIHNFGGLYIDSDFECYKNIDSLFNNYDFIVCNGDFDCINNYVLSNGLFASTKNNLITTELVNNINNIIINTNDINVESGPYYFGKIINNFNSFKILNSRLFYPTTYYEKQNNIIDSDILKDSYGQHHWGNSWNINSNNILYNKPKYIIYTSEFIDNMYGGVAIVTYNMYISLKKYYNTYVIIEDNNLNIKVYNNDIYHIFDTLENAINYININNTDIVICHNIERNYIYNIFENITKKTYMVIHGFYHLETLNCTLNKINIKYNNIIKEIYSKNENIINEYNNIIVVNPEYGSILKKKYINKNITYIPNCIKIQDSVYNIESLQSKLNSLNPSLKLIYIGRVEEYKNINILINTIILFPNISLTIIGTNYENINLNYNNIIYFEKINNNEISNYLVLHDMLINISLTESFPMVILEAGSNKLCCYISKLKGFTDIFEDCCFYSTNHLSINAIKKDLLYILNNKDIIYNMGLKLYNLINDNYNINYYHQYLYQLSIL